MGSTQSTWVHTHGIRGLYHGWWATLFREVPGGAIYFACYDYTKHKLMKNSTNQEVMPSWVASSLAGGISGCMTWAMVYPFDVIKTRIQTSDIIINPSLSLLQGKS